MESNFVAIIGATFVPLIIGFIWYHPKTFGTAWMKAASMPPDPPTGSEMAKMFGFTLLLSFFIALIMPLIVVHQAHFLSILEHQPDSAQADSQSASLLKTLLDNYGSSNRTFKHGLLHGSIAGFMLALPILGINALFEKKGFKYIAINSGYWIVSIGLMGGIICAYY